MNDFHFDFYFKQLKQNNKNKIKYKVLEVLLAALNCLEGQSDITDLQLGLIHVVRFSHFVADISKNFRLLVTLYNTSERVLRTCPRLTTFQILPM